MKNYTFSGNHPSMELVAELLDDLKKAETTLAAALARAEAAEGDLRELRENILLALGMSAEDVAEMDDGGADSTARYLLSALVKELAALKAGEWRPVTEPPTTGAACEIKVLAEYFKAGEHHAGFAILTSEVYTYLRPDHVLEWRPAPPQE